MSRAVVRQVTQAWFDPSAGSLWQTAGGVPDQLDKVWTSFPTNIDFRQNPRVDYDGDGNAVATHAQAVVFVTGQTERRETIGGDHQGWKYVTYNVVLQLFCESVNPDPTAVMTDIDLLADAIKTRAVADHTFGQTADVIFKAAEDQVSLDFGEPMLNDAGATEQWFQVRFTVEQFYQA